MLWSLNPTLTNTKEKNGPLFPGPLSVPESQLPSPPQVQEIPPPPQERPGPPVQVPLQIPELRPWFPILSAEGRTPQEAPETPSSEEQPLVLLRLQLRLRFQDCDFRHCHHPHQEERISLGGGGQCCRAGRDWRGQQAETRRSREISRNWKTKVKSTKYSDN